LSSQEFEWRRRVAVVEPSVGVGRGVPVDQVHHPAAAGKQAAGEAEQNQSYYGSHEEGVAKIAQGGVFFGEMAPGGIGSPRANSDLL
jgi:hypothetical protein